MASCIAFHSYKGGTGKTTIAANLAALLAKKGYRVFLLDLDVYAPSLHSYFDKNPKRWINDFLNGSAEVGDIIMDVTSAIEEISSAHDHKKESPVSGENQKITGRLWVGFSSPKKEEIYRLEGGSGKQESSKIQLLRRFILLREQLISLHDADYIIIDTSPGIRYWSINALAVADTLFLTLKMGDLDIEGTRKMAEEIYGSFTKFGARSYLVMNRVAGYCVPINVRNPQGKISQLNAGTFDYGSPASHSHGDGSLIMEQQKEESTVIANSLASEVRMDVISAISCYCDIQFSNKEFLTVIKYPNHPFAHQFEQLTQIIERMQKRS
ncbi:MAG TPA: ParA family protein [Nitrososphaeraceae archaeon]|nr:ParA family protein [Nitrososphaeraceae archaeon]